MAADHRLGRPDLLIGAAGFDAEHTRMSETEVLALISEGLSNPEIGERLVLGQATVKPHLNRIFAKIRVRNRAQAVRYAVGNGLARPDSKA